MGPAFVPMMGPQTPPPRLAPTLAARLPHPVSLKMLPSPMLSVPQILLPVIILPPKATLMQTPILSLMRMASCARSMKIPIRSSLQHSTISHRHR